MYLKVTDDARKDFFTHKGIASSQTLYFLFKVRRAGAINRRGFIDRQHKGVVVGEEENRRSVDIFGSN